MLNRYHWLNKYIFLGFYNIPFIFELRTIIDWTYAKSALDVYQWIKLSQIQADLYKAKCNNLFYMKKKVGAPLPSWYRYLLGIFLMFLILALSLGPMFLFSSFDIFGDYNPVQGVTIQLSLVVDKTPQKLFETSSILIKEDRLTEAQYNLMQFDDAYETRNYERNQIQYIIMNDYSQEKWSVSPKVIDDLVLNLEHSKNLSQQELQNRIKVEMRYLFTRSYPKSALSPIGNQTLTVNANVVDNFIDALKMDCSNTSAAPQAIPIGGFQPIVALGQHLNVEKLQYRLFQQESNDDPLEKTILLKYDCLEQWTVTSTSKNDNEKILQKQILQEFEGSIDNREGLSFFLLSRKTLPSIINFPLVTFYISIIYVIAKLFRSGLVPVTAATFVNDSPFPEDVLMLCETIALYRLKGRLADEEELFFLLIDVMRSPQVLKAICGDSTKTAEKQLVQE